MLKKLRLDQSNRYQQKIAVEYISDMLVDFVLGRSHYLEIGSEQGDTDNWDDLIIKLCNGDYTYFQIKRQTTDFSTDSVTRNKDRNGNLKKLSTLDETFKSLGDKVHLDPSVSSSYRIILPEGSIKIKKDLYIRQLREYKNQIIKGITTNDGLIELEKNDSSSKNVYSWLTTWCEFIDREHILKVFNLLNIETEQLEPEIETRVKGNLKQIFKESEIEHIYLLLLSYVVENTVFTGPIKPRQLLYLLKDYLLPNIAKWTLFELKKSFWNISGIQDLKDNCEIERPAVIVPSFWAKGNPYARTLRIYGDYVENCPVSESLMRLSAHPQGSFDIFCSNKSSWYSSIKNKTGGTLGVSKSDFDDFRILQDLEHISPSELKQLNTNSEIKIFAKELNDEMYKNVLELIDNAILNTFREMINGDLVAEIESRWTLWKQSLEENIEEQKELFSKILHPNAEGKSICGEVRVGPKTVKLLSDAIVLLLVVSVCLADADNQDWKSVKGRLKMTSIGLAYWSGPADSSKNLIAIDDDEGISNLIEYEPSQIIMIPQSVLTDTEIFEDDISGEFTKFTLLSHPKYPKLLITKDRIFKRLLIKGDTSELKEYFQSRIDKYEDVIEHAISHVVEGL